MPKRPALSVLLALCAAVLPAVAEGPPTRVEDPKLARFFGPFTGCLLLHDVDRNTTVVVNPDHCARRTSPCSTFKIWHSLVALETGAIDEATVLPWDGKDRGRPEINKDLELEAAFRASAVWFYQQVAARIGAERMEGFMNAVPYGNRDLSGGLTTFWLSSTLEISPEEQLHFLRQLYGGKLPFKPGAQDAVRRFMVQETREDGSQFCGKTGSGHTKEKKALGWFAGRVKAPKGEYLFVVEIEGAKADGRAAREIALDVLSSRKIW